MGKKKQDKSLYQQLISFCISLKNYMNQMYVDCFDL